jgi:catechol 2,3-dioxygenase-like lactoylglutathione lyase family enzyme
MNRQIWIRHTLRLLTSCVLAASIGRASDAVTPATGFDNVHIRVSDPAKAVEWYVKYFGGTSPGPGQVYIGKVLIQVVRTTSPQPSAGSAIDHFGLSFANVDAQITELSTSGAKVISPPGEAPGMLRSAYIEDPWGVKIQLVQDPDLLGFHHVYLSVKDPDATLHWYEEVFGGERGKWMGRIDGLRFGSVWLFAAGSGSAIPAPSALRAIQSFGVRVPNADQAAVALVNKGIKLVTPPSDYGDLRYAFAEDPNGVRFEVAQRPRK